MSVDFDIASTIRALSISRVGISFNGKVEEGAIYRLRAAPSKIVDYAYLVVSENADEPIDILIISDFKRFKKQLKNKVKKGTGLEMTISPLRKMDSASVGKWFYSLRELSKFCHLARCQLILSSGATSKYEMVSGPCFDAILRTAGIDPQGYWLTMTKWLEERLARNVVHAKETT